MFKSIKDHIDDEDSKEILSKSFSFIIIRIGGLIAGFIFTYFIAKFFGPSINGLVALGFTLILCTSIIGVLGFDVNLVRYYSRENNKNDKGQFYRVIACAFLASAVLSLIMMVLKDYIVFNIFKKPQFEPYIFWIAITIPTWSIVLVCGGFLRAKKKNNWFVFLSNSGRFFFSTLFFGVFILFSKDDLVPVKAHFFGILLLAIIGLLKSVKLLGGVSFKTHNSTWLLFKDSLPIMISSTVIVFLGWTDTFMLGIYETDDIVGVYNVSLRLASLTIFPYTAINSILAPKIAKSYNDEDYENFKRIIKFATKYCFIITFIVGALIILFRKYLLSIFGQEFVLGHITLTILCLGQIIMAFSGFIAIILQMTGFQKIYRNIVLVALFLNILLNYILTPNFGSVGAAIATTLTLVFWNAIGVWMIKKKLKINSYFTF
ncbi:MAG: flippase [Ignavibacteriae bacterium]|nr:flippase [Ignavibacteriota bacterium]